MSYLRHIDYKFLLNLLHYNAFHIKNSLDCKPLDFRCLRTDERDSFMSLRLFEILNFEISKLKQATKKSSETSNKKKFRN